MKRHHSMLVVAIMSVALSGCAVLVQYGQPEVDATGAYQTLTALPELAGLNFADNDVR